MSKEAMQMALEAILPHKSTITRAYTLVDAAIDALRTALAQPEIYAVLAEREACAKICDAAAEYAETCGTWGQVMIADKCAVSIRARGQA